MEQLFEIDGSRLYAAISLGTLCLTFVLFFVAPAAVLGGRLKQALRALSSEDAAWHPMDVSLRDSKLQELWAKYCLTLKRRVDRGQPGPSFATNVTAATFLNPESVIEERIHGQLFRHFPVIACAIGAVGVPLAVVDATSTAALDEFSIGAIRTPIFFATLATCLAIVIAFCKTLLFSWMRGALATLCNKVDARFYGPSEELVGAQNGDDHARYSRLVRDAFAHEREEMIQAVTAIVAVLRDEPQGFTNLHAAAAQRVSADAREAIETLVSKIGAQSEAFHESGDAILAKLSAEARRAIEPLACEVRGHRDSVRGFSQEMRGAAKELTEAVGRSVESLDQGASNMQVATKEFLRTGLALSTVFDTSTGLGQELAVAAKSLAMTSSGVGELVADYRRSKETFSSIAAELRKALEANKQDDLSARLERVCAKLIAVQTEVESNVDRQKSLIGEAQDAFAKHLPALHSSADLISQSTTHLKSAIQEVGPSSNNIKQPRLAMQADLERALVEFRHNRHELKRRA